MNKTYPNLDKHFPELLNSIEHLMSYSIGKLFTCDTPDAKEKKLETRCTKIVDGYYSIESIVHQSIRNLLHDTESTLLLFSDTITPEMLSASLGGLQAEYELHKKHIEKCCKPEKILLDYYSTLIKTDEWQTGVESFLKSYNEQHNSKIDVDSCRKVYYDSYKSTKKHIQSSPWRGYK